MPINIFMNASDAQPFEPGQIIFEEGDPGETMYAVTEGRVDIIVGGHAVETVEAGGIIGEMALIDSGPRSATAVAATAAKLVTVDRNQFTFLVQEHPTFALQVMKIMAERLRRADASA
jgi:CRP/FNR family transcriptional regulator, cyclic AMP receptor protein